MKMIDKQKALALYQPMRKRADGALDSIAEFVKNNPQAVLAAGGTIGGGLLGRLVSGNWRGGLLGALLGGGAGYAGGGWWQANRLGAGLQAQNKGMQAQLHGANTKIDALNKQLADARASALTAAQSAQSKQEELQGRLNTATSDLDAARNALNEANTNHAAEVERLNADLGAANATIDTANAKLDELTSDANRRDAAAAMSAFMNKNKRDQLLAQTMPEVGPTKPNSMPRTLAAFEAKRQEIEAERAAIEKRLQDAQDAEADWKVMAANNQPAFDLYQAAMGQDPAFIRQLSSTLSDDGARLVLKNQLDSKEKGSLGGGLAALTAKREADRQAKEQGLADLQNKRNAMAAAEAARKAEEETQAKMQGIYEQTGAVAPGWTIGPDNRVVRSPKNSYNPLGLGGR